MKKKGFLIYIFLCIVILASACCIKSSMSQSEYFLTDEAVGTTLIDTNDVRETDDGYSITGEDAYVVFMLNKETSCINIRLIFPEELNTKINVQVYYADRTGEFSENRSFLITVKKGSNDLIAELPYKNVQYIRIDFNEEEGLTFSFDGLQVVERNLQTVCKMFVSELYQSLQVALTCLVFFSLIYFGLYFSLKCKEKRNCSEMLLMMSGWAAVIFFVYIFVWFDIYTISSSNMMYIVSPWSDIGVTVGGPNLSDDIDSHLPALYSAYYSSDGFSFWKNTNAFGSSVGVELYLNPFNWFYLFPLKYAVLFKSIFEFSMAYFGMCYLLKRLKLCVSARMLGGVAYALSSAMVMWHFWSHTDVMMLAPLALALGDKLIKERKLKDVFLLAIVTFLMFIAGMPTYAAYVFYLQTAYMLVITIFYYRKQIGAIVQVYIEYAISAILGVLAAFPYLRTLLGTVGANGYAASRAYKARQILPIEYLRTVFLPYYREGLAFHTNESTIYIGITMIIFLLFVFIRWKQKGKWFWTFSFLILVLLCFTHVLDGVYIHMPGINTSLKYRLVSLLVFVAVVLASTCYDDILKHRENYKRIKWRWCVYLIYASLQIYISVCYWEESIWARWSILGGICSVAAIECIILCKKNILKKGLQCILWGIVVVNMGIFARLYFPTIESGEEIIPEATDSIQYLQENIDSQRIYTMDEWTFFPNTNVFYGLSNIAGHLFINTNNDVSSYLQMIDDEMAVTSTAYHGSKIDNYNLLRWGGVKYIVVDADYDETKITDATLVYSGDDGLDIYELDQYNERFFLSEEVVSVESEDEILELMADDYSFHTVYVANGEYIESDNDLTDQESISILFDETDEITLQVETSEKRIVVFNEYYDGNWKVYIDGEEQDVLKVNYLFNGVEVDSGTHTIEFVYDVHDTMAFCIISIIDIGFILGGLVICLFIEKRKQCNLERRITYE